MCKALSVGGKRCAVHRSDVKAYIKSLIQSDNFKNNPFLNEKLVTDVLIALRKTATVQGDADKNQIFNLFKNHVEPEDFVEDNLDAKTAYALNGLSSYIKWDLVNELVESNYGITTDVGSEAPMQRLNDLFAKNLNATLPSKYSEDELKELDEIAKEDYKSLTSLKQRLHYAKYLTRKDLIADFAYAEDTDDFFKLDSREDSFIFNEKERTIFCHIAPIKIGEVEIPHRLLAYSLQDGDDFSQIKNDLVKEVSAADFKNEENPLASFAMAFKTVKSSTGENLFATMDTSLKLSDEEVKNIVQGKGHRKCAYCGQFLGMIKNHSCPEKAEYVIAHDLGNQKIAEQLSKTKKLSLEEYNKLELDELLIKTNEPFTLDGSTYEAITQHLVDYEGDDGGSDLIDAFAERHSLDKEKFIFIINNKNFLNNIIGVFPIDEYYQTNLFNNYGNKSSFNKITEEELSSAVEYHTSIDMNKKIERSRNIKDIIYIKNSANQYLKKLPYVHKIKELVKEGKPLLVQLESSGWGEVIFYKDEDRELAYDVNSLRLLKCPKCRRSALLRYSEYCDHKLEIKKELDEYIRTSKKVDEYPMLSQDEVLFKEVGIVDGIQEDADGKKFVTLPSNPYNKNIHVMYKVAAISEAIYESGTHNIPLEELSSEEKARIISIVRAVHSAREATTEKKSEEFINNNSLFTAKTDYYKSPYELILNEDGNAIKVTGSVSYDYYVNQIGKELKCSCAEYTEKYYCPHINIAETELKISSNEELESDYLENLEVRNLAVSLFNSYGTDTSVNFDNLIEKHITLAQRLNETKEKVEIYNSTINKLNVEDNAIFLQEGKKYSEKINNKINKEKEEATFFSDKPELFFEPYQEAINNKRHKKEIFEYKYENVTNGVCAPEIGAKKFGYEIEVVYDGEEDDKENAITALIDDFYKAGLTDQENSYLASYHSNARNGYKSWSIEADGTVDVEVVSPQLYDSPECWEQLEIATELLKKHGFTIDERCGGHISVSTHTYIEKLRDGTNSVDYVNTAKLLELKNSFDENYEVFTRLGQDTNAGKHRGMEWCAPNFIPFSEPVKGDKNHLADGDSYDNPFRTYRESGVNVAAMVRPSQGGYDNGASPQTMRAEYRIFDGSLDPKILQQRLKLVAALTQEAENQVNLNDNITYPKKHNYDNSDLLMHQKVKVLKEKEKAVLDYAKRTTHNLDTLAMDAKEVMDFADRIFTRDEDKQDVARLFAVTKW